MMQVDSQIPEHFFQLTPGASADDRQTLSLPISPDLILAGEAFHPTKPAMVHGAFESGEMAAQWALSDVGRNESLSVIVIGAGAAGIGCARYLHERGANVHVIEARSRVGGRAYSVTMENYASSSSYCRVDTGPTWLQQFPTNTLAKLSAKYGLTLIPSDFNNPLCASADGLVAPKEIEVILDNISDVAETAAHDAGQDMPLLSSLADYYDGLDAAQKVLARLAMGDILIDSGVSLAELSAKNGLSEPGVGDNDHYICEGFSTLFERLSSDLNIKFDTVVREINWGQSNTSKSSTLPSEFDLAASVAPVSESSLFDVAASVAPASESSLLSSSSTQRDGSIRLITEGGSEFFAHKCICTVPISLIQDGSIRFVPPLPERHRIALSKIKLGMCNKVILQYQSRWWPVSPGGIIRWYGTGGSDRSSPSSSDRVDVAPTLDRGNGDVDCSSDVSSDNAGDIIGSGLSSFTYIDWLDMTDGLGVPIVMGFVAGQENIDRCMPAIWSDEQVAHFAAEEFAKWAAAVLR